MEQQELGMTEEPITSAELSGLETAPASSEEIVQAGDSPATDTPDSSATGFKKGALVEGVVISVSPTLVTFDLGDGKEGVINNRELSTLGDKFNDFVVGKTMRVLVISPRGKDGKTVLSYGNALEEADWELAQEYADKKEVYQGKIGGFNKGGLIVKFNRLRGFVPQSQISEARLRSLTGDAPEQKYSQSVNQPISVKVMEVDRQRNRLILSERAADREVRQSRKQSLIGELQVGDEREGTVVSLESFGAFVDIGGAEGLVHLSELSHHHITHPRQAVSVGDQIRVKVIDINAETNRIALSLKTLLADPWEEIARRYAAGTLVRATITKTAKFGAFARIEGADDIEGLVHISELSEERIENPGDVVKRGDVLTLRVLRVDTVEKRLALSLKKIFSQEYLDSDIVTAYDHPELVEIPARVSKPKAAVEKARRKGEEIIADLSEGAETMTEEGKEVIADLSEKAADVREEVTHEAEEVRDDLSDKAEDVREDLSEKLADAREKGAEIIADLGEKTADVREDLSEKLADAREKGAEILADLGEKTADVREDLSEKLADAREKGAEIIADLGEKAADLRESLSETLSDLKEKITGADQSEDAAVQE